MDYSGTLRRGWEITWRNKWLWLLALLPVVLSSVNFFLTPASSQLMLDPAGMTPEEVSAFAGRSLLMACLSMLLVLVILVLNLITRGGIMTGVARLARGEATGFGRSFNEGARKVWPLLGMSIMLYGLPVILFIVAIIASLAPLMLSGLSGGAGQDELMAGMGVLGTVLICCVFVAYFVTILLLSLIYPFAYRGIMLRNLGVVESLRHGWRVLRDNVGEIILLALPFVLMYVLIFGLFGALFFALVTPEIVEGNMLSGGTLATNWRFVLAFLVYGLVASVLAVWQSAAFTLGYLQWTGKDVLGEQAAPPAPLA
jgi:hypothetical protein